MNRIQVLDGTKIKLAMLVLMVMNHIHEVFSFTEKVPLWFDYIGYAVGPCFLFLMVEGFLHTRNRKHYYLKIWLVSALMYLFQWCMRFEQIGVRADGFWPSNGILANFLIVFVFLIGMESLEKKQYAKGTAILAAPVIWTALGHWIGSTVPGSGRSLFLLHALVFPNALWIDDGLLILLVPGIVIYLLRKNRVYQVIGAAVSLYLSAIVLLGGLYTWLYYGETAFGFCAVHPTVIAVSLGFLPMLFYNGKRGRGMSRLFYYFYPIHVYVLCALGGIVYEYLYPNSGQIASVTLPMLVMALTTGLVLAGRDYLSKA